MNKKQIKEFDKQFNGELWLGRPEDHESDRKELLDFISSIESEARSDERRRIIEKANLYWEGITTDNCVLGLENIIKEIVEHQ